MIRARAAEKNARQNAIEAEKRRVEAEDATKLAVLSEGKAKESDALSKRRLEALQRRSYISDMQLVSREWEANNIEHLHDLLNLVHLVAVITYKPNPFAKLPDCHYLSVI